MEINFHLFSLCASSILSKLCLGSAGVPSFNCLTVFFFLLSFCHRFLPCSFFCSFVYLFVCVLPVFYLVSLHFSLFRHCQLCIRSINIKLTSKNSCNSYGCCIYLHSLISIKLRHFVFEHFLCLVFLYLSVMFLYCNLVFLYCNLVFLYCNLVFLYCNLVFLYCNLIFIYCNLVPIL